MTFIKPTVGRVVWYYERPPGDGDQPLAAHIAYVHSDALVNLMVIDANGESLSKTSVTLRQDDSGDWGDRPYCTWMPYQKGQAAKYEGTTEGKNETLQRISDSARRGFKDAVEGK